jgi:CRISPR/Cas system-associated exonuclease Cas4 (RecB family)
LTKTKEVQIEQHQSLADPRSIDRARRVAERVWRSIEAEHFYPAPSPMNCGSCPFRAPCREWPA